MASLRDIVDGNVVCAAAPKAIKPSPSAQSVAEKMQDPLGATKAGFSKLTKAKMDYDQAREEMQRELAPTQATLDHISQVHGIQPGRGTPGMMPAEQPGMGMNPDDPEQYDEQGNPLNMGQTVGKMNMNRPSLAGNQPGVSPGPQQSVVPPKMGMPKPGAQGSTFNKQAAPPKGNRSMPGAKGPGDPKVGNKIKKAQNDSKGREVELHIKGSGDLGRTVNAGASNRLSTQFGFSMLKAGSVKATNGPQGGPGMSNAPTAMGGPGMTGKPLTANVKALASGLSDKATDMGEESEESYNPVIRSGSRKRKSAAKKGWSVRNHGHLSAKEKEAHHNRNKFKKLLARDFSQGQRKKLAKSGDAMPGGGFPIANKQDLKNAKRAIGRAKDRSATISHINKRAKALGAPGFGK